MKKRFLSLLLAVTMAAGVFTGCGGDSSTSTNAGGVTDHDGDSSTSANAGGVFEKKEWNFSEYISSGETIWYTTNGTAKDSTVGKIYVIEPDGTLYYCSPKDCPSVSSDELAVFEQMDDEDIISEVKKGYETFMTEELSYYFEEVKEAQEDPEHYLNVDEDYEGQFESYSYIASLMEPYLNDIKPAQYELVIETDSTGNNTAMETLYFQESAPISIAWGSFYCKVYDIELNRAFDTYNIYDSWYGGYRLDTTPTYFLTRVNSEDVRISLDPSGTENVKIDEEHSFDVSTVFTGEVDEAASTENP